MIGMLFVSSCNDDKEVAMYSSSLQGQAIAPPATVKNGDETVLSIGGKTIIDGEIISISQSHYDNVSIDGKTYYPTVHYLIDGNEVAVSTGNPFPFNAKYVVGNLSVGEHVLSVNITSPREDIIFDCDVSSSMIHVVE